MKVFVYSAKDFEIPYLEQANNDNHAVKYSALRLTTKTAMMALGFDVISIFSADDASAKVLELLHDFGIDYITTRSAGHDNINLKRANSLGIRVANAPDYSPHAIAEHAITLIQAVNRKIIRADRQVKDYNFLLDDLIGFDLYQKKVGIIGTGRIGSVIAKILNGFDCEILAHDVKEQHDLCEKYEVRYTSLEEVYKESTIIILAAPLTSQTHHLIDASTIALMKKKAILINIARGALVKTDDLLDALKKRKLGAYATDVYEYEEGLFFYDHSQNKPKDNLLKALMSLPNVLITPHQAFATREALTKIAQITFDSITSWESDQNSTHELTKEIPSSNIRI